MRNSNVKATSQVAPVPGASISVVNRNTIAATSAPPRSGVPVRVREPLDVSESLVRLYTVGVVGKNSRQCPPACSLAAEKFGTHRPLVH